MAQREPCIRLHSNIPTLLAQKAARDRRQYMQRDISMQTGLSESVVSRLVNGDLDIGFGKVVTMARWLGVKVDDVYEVRG